MYAYLNVYTNFPWEIKYGGRFDLCALYIAVTFEPIVQYKNWISDVFKTGRIFGFIYL